MRLRSPPWPRWWILFCLLSAGRGLAAPPPTPLQGTVVELPEFVVKDTQLLPPPESWRYTRIPGFEVLSNASAGDTQRFLKDFQMFQQVVGMVWPGLREASLPPTTLILYGRTEGARDFLKSTVSMMGDEVIEIQASEPDFETAGSWGVASGFHGDNETACIVVNLQLSATGLKDPYRQFYGEYIRYLLSRLNRVPPWFTEGAMRLFAGADFTDKWIDFGKVDPGGRRLGDFNSVLGKPGVMGFPSFAEMLLADEMGMNDFRLRALAHEFVHMCLYGRGKRYQKAFFTYLKRIEKGEPGSVALFEACFGMSVKKMQDELQGYASFTDYQQVQFVARRGHSLIDFPKAVLREATQAEIGRIKGEGLVLAGKGDAARVAFLAPYIRGERDPELLAALGLFELRAGKIERARKLLESAVTGHTVRARACLELARLRHAEQEAASIGPLDGRQREAVLGPLRAAAVLSPPLVEVYELMTELWFQSELHPPLTDLDLLEKGVRHFPDQLRLVYRVAQLCAKSGAEQQAASLAEWGERIALGPADKERFAQIRASLLSRSSEGK